MRRGTTPTHTFELSIDTALLEKIKVIYAQEDVEILAKEADKCECEGNVVKVRLTQEETFKFDCKKPVQIQIRVLTKDGEALSSDVRMVSVEKCLDSEVL